jgi:hypothetical protein
MWHEWERRGICVKLLVGETEGKRPLGKPRNKRIDDIKVDVLETGLGVVD